MAQGYKGFAQIGRQAQRNIDARKREIKEETNTQMDKKLKDDILFLIGLQKAKDKNEPTGYDINLFKSSMLNKIKSMAKRGTQSEVDEALKYLYETNDKAGVSSVFTTSHSIWSFGTWQPVTIDYDGSTGERYAFYVNPDSKSVKVSNLKTGDESVYSNEEFVETNDLPASMVNMVSLEMLQKVRGWQIKSKAQPTAKSEEIKNENMSKSSSSSFSDKFFEENPEKILGAAEQKKDQWGKPMMYVKGGIENINQIDAPEIPDPTVTSNIGDSVISETTQSIINDPQNEENIDIAIEAAEKKIGNDVIKRQRRSKKGVGVSDSLSEIEHGMLSFDEVMKQYNEGITDEEIGIWVEFNERRGNPLGGNWNKYKPSKVNREWFIAMMKKGLVAYNPVTRDFEPEYIYYAGNIYEKISNVLQNKQAFAEVGEAQYEKQLEKLTELKNNKQLSLVAGDPQKRLIITPVSQFAKDFMISKLNDGTEFEEPVSLTNQFRDYIYQISDSDLQLPVSKYDIVRLYIDLGSDKSKHKSKEEKFENKKNARIEGERLFQKFLYEEITLEDKNKIEQLWNSQFNNWIDFNYNKIPVAFECSDTFKRGKMSIRPAQREAVAFMAINKTGVVAYDVGVGKGNLLTSDILTPQGFAKMGTLKVGDSVIGKNGKPTKIVGVYPLGRVQCYKVEFSDGSFTEVSDEHLWNVQTINYRSKYPEKWDTVRTKDIIDNLYNYRGDYQYSIPMVEAVEFEERKLPIHPYLLGVLLGDGGLSNGSVNVSNTEKDIIEKIKKLIPESVQLIEIQGEKDYRISRKAVSGENELISSLRELGLMGTKSNSKFIPEIYKVNSVENRLELFRGLLDTDGWIKTDEDKKGCSVFYTTVSEQLKDDVVFLAQSFGSTVIVKEKHPHYTHNGERKSGQLAYTISIRLPEGIIPVSSEKQLAKFQEKTKYQPVRFIKSITDIGQQEAQCIRVEASDSLYVCDDFIVTHNTMSAILSIAYTMQANQCKRPVIIVPNATYEKWKAEIVGVYNKNGILVGSGILPQYKINDYRNLGKGYFEKAVDEKTGIPFPIEEYSITVMTYEALTQIGFDIESNPALMNQILSVLEDSEGTARDKAGLFKKVEGIAGKVSKETKVNFEDFQFDYICVDEAHNFKNIFSGVRGDEKGSNKYQRPYEIAGTPSTRALKLFIISQLMYNKTGGKNICLLTATPFTNNPLEVYSMLSLCGYKTLKERGFGNLIDFFDSFVKQTYELTFNSKMEFQMKAVIKSWNNAVALRNIIFSLINYKSGEDANIQRPNKIVLPLMRENVNGNYVDLPDEKQILTFLTPTPEQLEYLADIQNYVLGESELADLCNLAAVPEGCSANDKMQSVMMDAAEIRAEGGRDKGRTLRALHYARSVTLSPYLYACAVYCGANPNDPEFYKEYVESSPKLKYVMGCINSVKKWHEKHGEPVSGQIIYMDAGKEYFRYIVEYLIREIGFKADEVKTITGDDSFAQREDTKSRFLAGEVKIIVGTGAIKEGIDLQDNTSVVYNCYMDWRPTDVKQLEGRAWRFGNRFANVRIVTPLLENSLDPFLFQKLEEKTARINDIFDRNDKKNILDVEEFNPEELKMGLITDPIKIAKEQVSQESSVVEREIKITETKISSISDVRRLSNQMQSYEKDILNKVEWKFKVLMESYSPRTIFTTDKEGNDITKVINAKEDLEEKGITSPNLDIDKAIEFGKYYDRITHNSDFSWMIGNYRDAKKKLVNLEKSVLQPRGFSLADDLESVIASMRSDVEALRLKFEGINSDDYINSLIKKYTLELEANRKKRGSIEQRVAAFATLNDKCLSEMMDYGQMQQAVVAESKKEKDEADNKNRMRMLALKAKADADALALLELEMEMGM